MFNPTTLDKCNDSVDLGRWNAFRSSAKSSVNALTANFKTQVGGVLMVDPW